MRLFLALLALFLSVPSFADTDSLYQVREPLAADTDAEQNIALSHAFDTLLLRLTANPQMAADGLRTLRQDPLPLINRYAKQGQELVVEFDPTGTLRLLQEQGLPLWSGQRPLLLLWWTESRGGTENYLLGDAQSGSKALQQAAQHRALPIRLPLADLPEQLIPAGQSAELLEAAQRYNTDGLLQVQVQDSGRQLQASWTLYLNGETQNGTAMGMDRETLADLLLLAVSQRLAERFAIASSTAEESQTLNVEIRGINLERYAQLESTLAAFPAQLVQLSGDRLLWRINAPLPTVRAHLALLRLHELSPSEAASTSNDSEAAADGRVYFSW